MHGLLLSDTFSGVLFLVQDALSVDDYPTTKCRFLVVALLVEPGFLD